MCEEDLVVDADIRVNKILEEIGYEEDSEAYSNKKTGDRGEAVACQFLERNGFEILERNWRCNYGEADIIALDDDCLVFIEVKTRSGEDAGLPEEAVTPAKRRRYENIAMAYLCQSDYGNIRVRFDVIGITMLAPDRAFMRHHRNAFGCDE